VAGTAATSGSTNITSKARHIWAARLALERGGPVGAACVSHLRPPDRVLLCAAPSLTAFGAWCIGCAGRDGSTQEIGL